MSSPASGSFHYHRLGNHLLDVKAEHSCWSAPELAPDSGEEPENLDPGLVLGLRLSAPGRQGGRAQAPQDWAV